MTKKVTVDSNGKAQATFEIKANFKGAIFAYATDNIDNTYIGDAVKNNGKEVFKRSFTIDGKSEEVEVVTANKAVFETSDHHDAEKNHIVYSKLPATDYKDAAGNNLYSSSVSIKVTVKDEFAGIESGKIEVKSTENREKENSDYPFSFDNVNSNYKEGAKVGGWTIEKMDGNMVVKISKTIKVKRDSNNIRLIGNMKDRDHNVTKDVKSDKFSIDKTAPKVVVTYDNNKASNDEYFNKNRTATIKVTERNFDPALFNVMVSKNKGGYNKNGESRVNVNWTPKTYNNSKNKEGTVYTATVSFTDDGHYTLSVNGVDRVHHKASVDYIGTATQKFTIDKTAPVVTVKYTHVNDSAHSQPQNGNYYSKTRTAHIEVIEHNWSEADDFAFLLKLNNGKATNHKLKWTHNGDRHTATYDADSKTGDMYTLDFTCKDRADNTAIFKPQNTKDYKPEVFYVDQTAPKVSFEFNGSDPGDDITRTTNGELASSASQTDTYVDGIEALVEGAAHTPSGPKAKGTGVTTVDIAAIIENLTSNPRKLDDFYTITVTAKDKSGNETVIKRSFAVNRNGSMFWLNDEAAALKGKATNDESRLKGLVIYEKNIDPVKIGKSKLVVNRGSSTITLEQGKHYTVSSDGERGADGYYTYKYKLEPETFKNESFYKVLVTTKDDAGNVSKNTNKKWAREEDIAEDKNYLPILQFWYDKTAPELDSDFTLDLSKQDDYYSIREFSKTVIVKPVDDVSGIDYTTIKIFSDKGPIEVEEMKENGKSTGEYKFVLKGTVKKLGIEFMDKAGNKNKKVLFKSITVSTNPFVQFFNNTPLFIGVLIGVVALALFFIILIAKRRKKDDEEETPETAA